MIIDIKEREKLWNQFTDETGRKFTDKDTYIYYADWLETRVVSTDNEQLNTAISALKHIADPIGYLKEAAEKTGTILDGEKVFSFAKQPGLYQDIAKAALKKINFANE